MFTIPYSINPIASLDLDLVIVVEGLVNLNTTSPIDYPLEVVITGNNEKIKIKRMIYVNGEITLSTIKLSNLFSESRILSLEPWIL